MVTLSLLKLLQNDDKVRLWIWRSTTTTSSSSSSISSFFIDEHWHTQWFYIKV